MNLSRRTNPASMVIWRRSGPSGTRSSVPSFGYRYFVTMSPTLSLAPTRNGHTVNFVNNRAIVVEKAAVVKLLSLVEQGGDVGRRGDRQMDGVVMEFLHSFR